MAQKKVNDPAKGAEPLQNGAALLLVDVINDFDFPESAKLLRYAIPAAKRIARLKRRLKAKGVPVVYVNDNFGKWRSDFKKQVERCIADDCMGAPIARALIPAEDDYFVLKPKHSGFFSTSLDVLLGSLGVKRVIITGFAGDICVLFTANDAYMRDYEVVVPRDCVACESLAAHRNACEQMRRFLRADTRVSGQIRVNGAADRN